MDKQKKIRPKKNVMKEVAAAIVRSRFLIMALFLLAGIYCAMSVGKVQVNDDITAFLPETTETRRGLTIMEEEFITYASADIMVSNITYEKAEEIADDLLEFDHVASVTLDDTATHYVNSAALLSVSFDGEEDDEDIIETMAEIRERLGEYDTYISSEIGVDTAKEVISQMGGVMVLTAIVIFGVLLFTSRSYFEVVIYTIVFAFAALLNMGTNHLLGEISSITNSISVIL